MGSGPTGDRRRHWLRRQQRHHCRPAAYWDRWHWRKENEEWLTLVQRTASLEFTLYGYHNTWQSDGKTVEEDVQIDVYPLYHNWIQMHDGRAHLSFQ